MENELKIRSGLWYLLPIFFKVIGGIIAYFVLRDDDPKKAKNCLFLGIAITGTEITLVVIFFTICTTIGPCAQFHDEFMNGMVDEEVMEQMIRP